MFEMTAELVALLRAFQKTFGDIVPLREIPARVTQEELIEAIKISIEKKENLLPKMLGYGELTSDPNILI